MEEYESIALKRIEETKTTIREHMTKIEKRFRDGIPHTLEFEVPYNDFSICKIALKEVIKKYEKDYIMLMNERIDSSDPDDYTRYYLYLYVEKRVPCEHCHGKSNC